ncbi:MAG: hypothetical protein ACTHWJ_06135 [Flaviflexus sp.]|uniref:hypothetical protein n=1 Tax=Flaviflexus sp. TaxID=1969482 RepID=UPI003F93C293
MSDDQIEAFWTRAITKARINQLEVVTGPDRDSALTPPAWSLDDETVEAALRDGKLVLTSAASQHEVLPKAWGLSILLWEDETPAALVQTTEVTVRTKEELDAEETIGDWATVRDTIPAGASVVVEVFKVLADNA